MSATDNDPMSTRAASPSSVSTASSNAALISEPQSARNNTILQGHSACPPPPQRHAHADQAASRSNNSSIRSAVTSVSQRAQRAMSATQIAQVQQQALLFQQQRVLEAVQGAHGKHSKRSAQDASCKLQISLHDAQHSPLSKEDAKRLKLKLKQFNNTDSNCSYGKQGSFFALFKRPTVGDDSDFNDKQTQVNRMLSVNSALCWLCAALCIATFVMLALDSSPTKLFLARSDEQAKFVSSPTRSTPASSVSGAPLLESLDSIKSQSLVAAVNQSLNSTANNNNNNNNNSTNADADNNNSIELSNADDTSDESPLSPKLDDQSFGDEESRLTPAAVAAESAESVEDFVERIVDLVDKKLAIAARSAGDEQQASLRPVRRLASALAPLLYAPMVRQLLDAAPLPLDEQALPTLFAKSTGNRRRSALATAGSDSIDRRFVAEANDESAPVASRASKMMTIVGKHRNGATVIIASPRDLFKSLMPVLHASSSMMSPLVSSLQVAPPPMAVPIESMFGMQADQSMYRFGASNPFFMPAHLPHHFSDIASSLFGPQSESQFGSRASQHQSSLLEPTFDDHDEAPMTSGPAFFQAPPPSFLSQLPMMMGKPHFVERLFLRPTQSSSSRFEQAEPAPAEPLQQTKTTTKPASLAQTNAFSNAKSAEQQLQQQNNSQSSKQSQPQISARLETDDELTSNESSSLSYQE